MELELEKKKTVLKKNVEVVQLKSPKDKLAKRIILRGPPGSGKTCLLSKLAYDWSQQNNNSPLNQFELLFLFRMQSLKQGCNLIDSICDQIIESVPNGLKSYIAKNEEKIIVLFDALDEVDLRLEFDRVTRTGIKELRIDQILNNQVLCNSCVIVTTRPHRHLGRAQSLYYTLVNVKGFSEKNASLYIRRYFSDNPDAVISDDSDDSDLLSDDSDDMDDDSKPIVHGVDDLASSLMHRLDESNNLQSISRIPIILMLLCTLWEDHQNFPNTMTLLYEEFVEIIWKRFFHKIENQVYSESVQYGNFLLRLGKTALEGIMPSKKIGEDVLEFSEERFGDCSKLGLKVGYITKQRLRFRSSEKTSISFLHKSIQEFCAGKCLAHLFVTDRKQFDHILYQIDSWELVLQKFELLRFCCGVSRQMMHDGVAAAAAVIIVEHVICKFGDMCRLNIQDSEFGIQVGHTQPSIKWDLFHVVTLFYEGQISKSFKNVSLFTNNILSDRLAISGDLMGVLHYFIQSEVGKVVGGTVKSVMISYYSSAVNFLPDVTSDILRNMPNITHLNVKFGDAGTIDSGSFTRFSGTVGRLKLSQLTISGLFNIDMRIILLSHLSAIKSLTSIDFSYNFIGYSIDLLEPIITNHLQHLKLRSAKLTEGHIEGLSAFLSKSPYLVELDLAYNIVGNAIISLTRHLQHCQGLRYLTLWHCSLSDTGVAVLAESFIHWPQMATLDLSDNPNVGNTGLDAACRHLHQLLKLTKFDITAGINNQCSTLIRECLKTIDQEIPEDINVTRSVCIGDRLRRKNNIHQIQQIRETARRVLNMY